MNIWRWCYNSVEKCITFTMSKMRTMAAVSYSTTNHATLDDMSASGSGDDNRSTGQLLPKVLIVGLGNHGFPNTRHSVGMRAVDRLAQKLCIPWGKSIKESGGFISATVVGDGEEALHVVLFKPRALMNINGGSVAKAAKLHAVPPSNIYLIHDELDKDVGKFHLKFGGSAGGHNGVLSCMNSLKAQDMPRLRIGISRPVSKSMVVSYVLENFNKSELPLVDSAIEEALDLLLQHIRQKFAPATASPAHEVQKQNANRKKKSSRKQKGGDADLPRISDSVSDSQSNTVSSEIIVDSSGISEQKDLEAAARVTQNSAYRSSVCVQNSDKDACVGKVNSNSESVAESQKSKGKIRTDRSIDESDGIDR